MAYSQLGNFFNASLEWQVSDSLAFMNHGTYDFDLSGFSRASVGMEINHTPSFTTFVEYRFVEAGESKILSLGATYEISDTYVIAVLPQYDFFEDKFQSIRADVTRAFPDFDLSLYVDYDSIRGETFFGASLGFVCRTAARPGPPARACGPPGVQSTRTPVPLSAISVPVGPPLPRTLGGRWPDWLA